MAEDRLVPEERVDAALMEIEGVYEKLSGMFVTAYEEDGTPLSGATPEMAARIWSALYAGSGSSARSGGGGGGGGGVRRAGSSGGSGGATMAAPAQSLDGRSAYCSCDCGCWRDLNEGDVGPTDCCDCEDSNGGRPCGCRGFEGEILRRVGRYTRWVSANAELDAPAPAGASVYDQIPPPTDADLPFE